MRYFHFFLYSVFEVGCILYMNTSAFELAVFHVLQSLARLLQWPTGQVIIRVLTAHTEGQGHGLGTEVNGGLKGQRSRRGIS